MQNYWVFVLCPSSGILGTRKHNVSETESVPSSGEGGREDTYTVGSLRKANLNHFLFLRDRTEHVSPLSPEDGKKSSF
jgi:hypothetical protein